MANMLKYVNYQNELDHPNRENSAKNEFDIFSLVSDLIENPYDELL